MAVERREAAAPGAQLRVLLVALDWKFGTLVSDYKGQRSSFVNLLANSYRDIGRDLLRRWMHCWKVGRHSASVQALLFLHLYVQ